MRFLLFFMHLLLISILPLGLGIVLSPEIFLLGFGLASSQNRPCLKAWLFCLGGFLGLMLMSTLGIFLHANLSQGPSWPKFCIRAGLGSLLFVVGIRALFKKSSGEKKRKINFTHANLSGSFGLGVLITTVNLKVGSFAITAGHQAWVLFRSVSERVFALILFLFISVLPLIIPAIIETIRPGRVALLMEPFGRALEHYGKWIVVLICFLMGSLLWRHALVSLP